MTVDVVVAVVVVVEVLVAEVLVVEVLVVVEVPSVDVTMIVDDVVEVAVVVPAIHRSPIDPDPNGTVLVNELQLL